MSTAELLGTLALDEHGYDQGKVPYTLALTGAAWELLHGPTLGRSVGGSPQSSPARTPGRQTPVRSDLAQLETLLPYVKVAARFTPTQKEEIVRALIGSTKRSDEIRRWGMLTVARKQSAVACDL